MTTKFKHSKVMVIDDNEIDRYVAGVVMEVTSFAETVIAMESAREALDYLLSHKDNPEDLPHLIFLDINMPGMNGFEFLDEYNLLPEVIKKNCIIMMLSTSLNREDKLRSEANEYVFKFLNKPLDENKLDSLHIDNTPGNE